MSLRLEISWRSVKCRIKSDFIDKDKVLYCAIQSVLKINGGLSAPFLIPGCTAHLK